MRSVLDTENSGNHYALSVTFKGIPESSHSVFFKGKPIDLESHIPSYDFTNFADFADFQSAVRNKIFVGAFAVAKIASETSGKYGDATDQHLKIWLDKETQQYSISYYASSLKKPCDLEFPFKVIRKEAERTKRAEELILRFDPTQWAQLRAASPSLVRTPSSNVLDSDYAPLRHITFSTLSTMSTDRTASTTGDFTVVRQHSDSGHSVANESLTSSSLQELTTEMKFLRITFSDDNEASSFHNAYRNAVASTPS
ncbi:hypothetical protein V498_06724 [Pseudogymnoascus sp. VKM F-4517 (FW-2822)]|nr:hypothetical protein V498_06724 [Pseudogymnoascus sp. VKM F-4517 (FW-2822)]